MLREPQEVNPYRRDPVPLGRRRGRIWIGVEPTEIVGLRNGNGPDRLPDGPSQFQLSGAGSAITLIRAMSNVPRHHLENVRRVILSH
jgi:hypothetical protein